MQLVHGRINILDDKVQNGEACRLMVRLRVDQHLVAAWQDELQVPHRAIRCGQAKHLPVEDSCRLNVVHAKTAEGVGGGEHGSSRSAQG